MFGFLFNRSNNARKWNKIVLFEDLGRREMNEFGRLLQPVQKKAGEMIFSQGDAGEGMYIVSSGSVSIFQKKPDGTHIKLTEVRDDGFFGEMALLNDSSRTASAVAVEDSELLMLSRSDLLQIAEDCPRVGVKIVMQLSLIVAERLRRANRALKEVRLEIEGAGKEA